MTTLSLERLAHPSRKATGDSTAVTRLARFVATQRNILRTSLDAAAAYDRAETAAARRAVLNRFPAQIRD